MPPDEELMDYDAYDDVAYTTEDLRAIQEMPSVNQVIAYAYNSTNVVYHQEAAGAQILAINENYYDLNEFTASSGRLLDNRDVDNGRRVVTLSTGVVEELFATNDEAVGQIVNIEGVPFEVIGVHERENQASSLFKLMKYCFLSLHGQCFMARTTWTC